jgi:chromosome partitioning protein
MAKIFSLCNQKGGVGKTTTVVNLATSLAQAGRKILLIDIDPQANATSGVGVDKNSVEESSYDLILELNPCSELISNTCVRNLEIIPSNAHLSGAEVELAHFEQREFLVRKAIEPLRNQYDFIFFDCPPSLGLLTLNSMTASDGILIPLQCEYYALEGLGQLLRTFQLVKEKLNPSLEIAGVILTMADFRTNLTQQVIEDVRNHFQERVFKTVIPRSVKISEAPSFGKPIALYDPHSKGAKCYEEVAKEFLEKFGKDQTPPSRDSNNYVIPAEAGIQRVVDPR